MTSFHSHRATSLLLYFSTFLLSLLFFSFLQPWGSFPDPDGFYHAKMAEIMLTGPAGPIDPTGINFAGFFFLQSFPWLDLTLLDQHFVDQHLLYHLALTPFVALLGMLPGAQIAAVIFAAAFITIFYAVLRHLRLQNPGLWTFLAAVSMPLAFRLALVKATPFALTAFVLGLVSLMSQGNNAPALRAPPLTLRGGGMPLAFFAGLLFALSHGGWMILLGSQVLFLFGVWIFDRFVSRSSTVRNHLSTIILSSLGITLALLLHPNRAHPLPFLKVQVLQVAIATPTNIALGLEWRSVAPHLLLANIAPLVIAGCFIVLGLILAARRPLDLTRARNSIGLGLVVATLTAFTLKNARMIEYLVPALILWLATLWTLVDPQKLFDEVKKITTSQYSRLFRVAGYSLLTTSLLTLLARDIRGTYRSLREGGGEFTRLQPIVATLSRTAIPGERIFHDRWDSFPELFALAPQFRYVSGLDPTFLLARNPSLAAAYERVTRDPTTTIPPSLQTKLMLLERTPSCPTPTKTIITKIDKAVLCR